MNKSWKKLLGILITALIVATLIYKQYSYASKTEDVSGLEYMGTVDVESFDNILIFDYEGKLVGFKDVNNASQWLVEGNTYTIKYKNKMWHRNSVILVDFEKME